LVLRVEIGGRNTKLLLKKQGWQKAREIVCFVLS